MNSLISVPFDWVGQGLLVALAVGFALSAAAGVLLVLRPDAGLRIDRYRRSNPWAKTRDFKDKLGRAQYLEALFDRYHRLLGGSMVAGAVYVLGSWMHAYDRMQVMSALAPRLPAVDGIVTWLESVAVVIHLLVLLMGTVIVMRPRVITDLLITGLGGRASHDYGRGSFAAMLAQEYHAVEQQLVLYPRLLGLVVLCGGAYALLALSPALLSVLRVV